MLDGGGIVRGMALCKEPGGASRRGMSSLETPRYGGRYNSAQTMK